MPAMLGDQKLKGIRNARSHVNGTVPRFDRGIQVVLAVLLFWHTRHRKVAVFLLNGKRELKALVPDKRSGDVRIGAIDITIGLGDGFFGVIGIVRMQCGGNIRDRFAGIADALKNDHEVVFARTVASMAPRVARLLKRPPPRGVGKARGLIDVELRCATRGRGGRRGRIARRGRALDIGAGVLAVLACGLELRLSIL